MTRADPTLGGSARDLVICDLWNAFIIITIKIIIVINTIIFIIITVIAINFVIGCNWSRKKPSMTNASHNFKIGETIKKSSNIIILYLTRAPKYTNIIKLGAANGIDGHGLTISRMQLGVGGRSSDMEVFLPHTCGEDGYKQFSSS